MGTKLEIEEVARACGHYRLTDNLFLRGYEQLLEGGLAGRRVLEVCCGAGGLAGWLARRTGAQVVGVDLSPRAVRQAQEAYGRLENVRFLCGDALELPELEPGSFDLIVGQAAMHHLAHDLGRASRRLGRLLKPGGRLLFLFEPLGHNPLVAAVRAVHVARRQWLDESNLFEWALRDFAAGFSRYEVQYFSLLAYPCKALPRSFPPSRWIYRLLAAVDQALFSRWPRIRKYAANCNVCYWK